MALPESTKFTEKEYYAIEAVSDIKHEFVNGYIYAMTGGSLSHNTISDNLFGQLFTLLRSSSCRAYHSDTAVKATVTDNVFYPDVSIICGLPQFDEIAMLAILLNPTVIFEVLSPSTAAYDRTTKFYNYAQIPSLQHYVLVEQDQPLVHVFTRNDANEWNPLASVEGIDAELTLPSIDVTLKFTDIYERVTFNDPPHTA